LRKGPEGEKENPHCGEPLQKDEKIGSRLRHDDYLIKNTGAKEIRLNEESGRRRKIDEIKRIGKGTMSECKKKEKARPCRSRQKKKLQKKAK